MNPKYYLSVIALIATLTTAAQHINWHNESADTLSINKTLKRAVMISDPENASPPSRANLSGDHTSQERSKTAPKKN